MNELITITEEKAILDSQMVNDLILVDNNDDDKEKEQ